MNNSLNGLLAVTLLFISSLTYAQNCNSSFDREILLSGEEQVIVLENIELQAPASATMNDIDLYGDIKISMSLTSFTLTFTSDAKVLVGQRTFTDQSASPIPVTIGGTGPSPLVSSGSISLNLQTTPSHFIFYESRALNAQSKVVRFLQLGQEITGEDLTTFELRSQTCGDFESINSDGENAINAVYTDWLELAD